MLFGEVYEDDFNYILQNFPIEEFDGSSWLITGASGFIMTYFIRFLLYANEYAFHDKCRLYLLCRNKQKLLAKLGLSEETNEMRILEQDVNIPILLDMDVNYAVHGASISSTRQFQSNPVEVITANTVGLYNVLSCLKRESLKSVLFLSSGAVYGEISGAILELKESDYFPLYFTDIRNCYAQSKRMGELLMKSYHMEYGLPCRSVRLYHTYGPGIDLNDGHVYSDFTRSIINQEDLVIYGDGTATRLFCYVADAVLAFLTILRRGKDGESYNLANNHAIYSIYELAMLLASEVADGHVRVERGQGQGSRDGHEKLLVSTSKLERLGWQPQIGVVEGFRRTIRSFEEEMMRKVLVTGGNGFIGRNLVESLGKSYQVCAPSRQEMDLLDTEKTRRYLEEQSVDTVIHCANTNSSRYDKGGGVNDYQILHDNLIMYWNIARCEDLYEKMYYFGSGAEFDREHYVDNMSEEYFDIYIPRDAYGFSKYIMNQNAKRSDKIYNLRLFGVYGKYEEWNGRFISNNMCRILRGLNISINQDMLFDYLYIEDLCRIMAWFVEHTPKFHAYNVCTGNSVRLSEIADVIGAECGRGLPVRILKEGEKLPYTADNTRLLAEIGGFAFTSLAIGVRRLWKYYSQAYRENESFRMQVDQFAFG